MRCAIAFYCGPPRDDWQHTISHYGIRVWTWSRWSHAELVIDGWCYSASARDGGVRAKQIDLTSGRWDVVEIFLTQREINHVLWWFAAHDGDLYDWAGIGRFVVPLLPHHPNRRFCFEAIGDALGLAAAHKLTANDLYRWALTRRPSIDPLTPAYS